MNFEEFCAKYDLDAELLDDLGLIDVLDDLYLKYTEEQLVHMVMDYYENADEIQNSIKESREKYFEE